jgi:uncharacterized protein (TIGR03382 family)
LGYLVFWSRFDFDASDFLISRKTLVALGPPPMKTTKLLICAVAVAAAFAAVKAQGQNLTATLSGIDPGLAVNGTFNDGAFVQDYPSGVLDFGDFEAFCVETEQDISFGETVIYQFQDPSSLTNSETIARLVGGFLASSRTALHAAAVQWAIWETTSETLSAASLFDGNVRITVPVSENTAALANQYLANVNTFTHANLVYLTNGTHQDVVSWNAVPEPASAGLAALSGLLLLRRRRK